MEQLVEGKAEPKGPQGAAPLYKIPGFGIFAGEPHYEQAADEVAEWMSVYDELHEAEPFPPLGSSQQAKTDSPSGLDTKQESIETVLQSILKTARVWAHAKTLGSLAGPILKSITTAVLLACLLPTAGVAGMWLNAKFKVMLTPVSSITQKCRIILEIIKSHWEKASDIETEIWSRLVWSQLDRKIEDMLRQVWVPLHVEPALHRLVV
ncbi:hypothetical protein JCM5296_004235 [Sporobolomyces johnsonii]